MTRGTFMGGGINAAVVLMNENLSSFLKEIAGFQATPERTGAGKASTRASEGDGLIAPASTTNGPPFAAAGRFLFGPKLAWRHPLRNLFFSVSILARAPERGRRR
jgi:hypothetical protein